MPAPFVGFSYSLGTRTADVQRAVNCYPAPIESGSGKNLYQQKAIPGLVSFCDVGSVGRGAYEINGRAWVVVDSTLWELSANGAATSRGTLLTSTGFVSIKSNTVQLYLTDGANGYRLTLATNDFARITDSDFPGSDLTDYLDQYAIYAASGDQKFYISTLADAGEVDALDFASSEASPDNLVAFRVINRQLWLLGSDTGEVWDNTGAQDFPLQRNNGSIFSIGCSAKWTMQPFNNTVAWVGSDKAGGAGVWMASGYQGQRISNRFVEQAIAGCTDLARAIAYTQRIDGSIFYCLQLPGVNTTLCFDALTGGWHDRAELIDGEYRRHRISWHFSAFGKELGLGTNGVVYEWSKTANTNAGDTLVRDRITPHNALPDQRPVFYSDFRLDMDAGFTGSVLMRYSNDGGASWGSWDARSLGGPGSVRAPLRWLRCGSANDRVWHVRCTDDVPFGLVNATVVVAQ